MKSRNYAAYAIAVAIAFIGALWLGVPAGTLILLGLLVTCPLMMVLMMRGMHGDNQGEDPAGRAGPHDHRPSR
jgi:Protein of unknown function (DUF2933)